MPIEVRLATPSFLTFRPPCPDTPRYPKETVELPYLNRKPQIIPIHCPLVLYRLPFVPIFS